MSEFEGDVYRTADNWFDIIPVELYLNEPLKYLEIGTYYGANLLSVAHFYGSHEESELHCIDPWEDYNDYDEYKGKQDKIYNSFLNNINNSNYKDKIKIHRGYSHEKLLTFEDEYFDIIYIDGNHEPEYVMEDAIISFRKVKKGGFIIFDDYGWGGKNLTQKGIDCFLVGYSKKIKVIGAKNNQIFCKKRIF
uniref:Methyltransferase n=1 Tax=viral metagenome TaxID=1070528 RepID=A0A6C0D989_9ZZZZ